MAIKFIHNEPISACFFVECYTGMYYTRTSTFEEVKDRLARHGIHIGPGYTLMNNGKIPADGPCILVDFAKDEDYTQHDYRIMRIQKKYLNRFKKNLAELY